DHRDQDHAEDSGRHDGTTLGRRLAFRKSHFSPVGRYHFQRASFFTTSSASSTCLPNRIIESNRWRSTPPLSNTYVTRPGKRPSVRLTPHDSATLPSGSLSSRNGSRWCDLNLSCEAALSRDTPITSAPAPTK